jgi:hydrogenase maturation protease
VSRPGDGAPLLVLGLGNVLCGDDGLGVVAVTHIANRYEIPEGLRLLDGGTLGLSLLRYFDEAEDVLLVDAIRGDAPPGALVRLEGDEVAPAVRDRLSPHQIGVADLLDSLRLLDAYPRRMTLLGLVPVTLELGLSLSAPVQRGLPILVEAVVAEIRRLGFVLVPRKEGETRVETLDTRRAARALGL